MTNVILSTVYGNGYYDAERYTPLTLHRDDVMI
jgi:hypothetical protein